MDQRCLPCSTRLPSYSKELLNCHAPHPRLCRQNKLVERLLIHLEMSLTAYVTLTFRGLVCNMRYTMYAPLSCHACNKLPVRTLSTDFDLA
jgi:hypothetical protein